jgi:hypothetical protein
MDRVSYHKGDLVECLVDYPFQFTKGKVYEVRENHYAGSERNLTVVVDDRGSRSNGWNARYFKKVTPHIVIAKTDTGYSPNENPKVHPSFDTAAAEAKRLAKTIGGEFVVFAPVGKAVAPKVEVEFTKL